MKKYIKILILTLILTGCAKENKNTGENYPLSKLDNFSYDESLLTGERLIDYPSKVDKNAPSYKKSDLDNLDYNKELRFGDIYFRIPDKCAVFKKDDQYFIDFPLDLSYNILINFSAYDSDKDLIELCQEIINKENMGKNLISRPVENKLDNLESAYFIATSESYTYTHYLLRSENSTIYFTIKSDSAKIGSNIMADMLITAYTQGDDTLEVNKSFKDYKNNLSIYATRRVEMSGLTMKIPENFYLNQDSKNFKSFVAKEDNEVIAEIIMKEDRIDGSIYKALGLNSGNIIYPTKIINMGKASYMDNVIECDARVYMRENTLTGKKFVIKTDNSYLTIIVVGPLENQSLVKSMADSIKDSIE